MILRNRGYHNGSFNQQALTRVKFLLPQLTIPRIGELGFLNGNAVKQRKNGERFSSSAVFLGNVIGIRIKPNDVLRMLASSKVETKVSGVLC